MNNIDKQHKIKYYSEIQISDFLPCKTPIEWINKAIRNIDILLIDHAHCEKKAASSAMMFLYRHDKKIEMLAKMSKIARQELVHFEQVLTFIKKRNIPFVHLEPSRYAKELQKLSRTGKDKNKKLVDTLIIGAIIEARSCERFSTIAPYLDDELKKFYLGLLESEKRHFTIYLNFAQMYAHDDIQPHIDKFLTLEQQLIEDSDEQFRFHSGV